MEDEPLPPFDPLRVRRDTSYGPSGWAAVFGTLGVIACGLLMSGASLIAAVLAGDVGVAY